MLVPCRSCFSLFSVTIAKYLSLGGMQGKADSAQNSRVRALCGLMPHFEEDIRADSKCLCV